jgi:uncharacterized protein (TIGR02996 family)
MSQDEAFRQAILQDPDDDGVRLVYADWLEERGDVRGEFIRLDCTLARLPGSDPRRPPLEARRRQLLAEHRDAWLGPLRGLAYAWEFRRGFVEEVTADARPFVQHADTFFAAAPLRLVRLLHAAGAVAALAECRHLARVRALHLTDNGLGDERLASLLGSRHLDGLDTLRLGNNGVSEAGAAWLAGAAALPRLTALNLSRNALGDRGARALAYSRKLAALTTLHLGNNGIGDAGAEALAAAPGLPRLAVLDLTDDPDAAAVSNRISRKQRQRLRERFGAGVRFAAGAPGRRARTPGQPSTSYVES